MLASAIAHRSPLSWHQRGRWRGFRDAGGGFEHTRRISDDDIEAATHDPLDLGPRKPSSQETHQPWIREAAGKDVAFVRSRVEPARLIPEGLRRRPSPTFLHSCPHFSQSQFHFQLPTASCPPSVRRVRSLVSHFPGLPIRWWCRWSDWRAPASRASLGWPWLLPRPPVKDLQGCTNSTKLHPESPKPKSVLSAIKQPQLAALFRPLRSFKLHDSPSPSSRLSQTVVLLATPRCSLTQPSNCCSPLPGVAP